MKIVNENLIQHPWTKAILKDISESLYDLNDSITIALQDYKFFEKTYAEFHTERSKASHYELDLPAEMKNGYKDSRGTRSSFGHCKHFQMFYIYGSVSKVEAGLIYLWTDVEGTTLGIQDRNTGRKNETYKHVPVKYVNDTFGKYCYRDYSYSASGNSTPKETQSLPSGFKATLKKFYNRSITNKTFWSRDKSVAKIALSIDSVTEADIGYHNRYRLCFNDIIALENKIVNVKTTDKKIEQVVPKEYWSKVITDELNLISVRSTYNTSFCLDKAYRIIAEHHIAMLERNLKKETKDFERAIHSAYRDYILNIDTLKTQNGYDKKDDFKSDTHIIEELFTHPNRLKNFMERAQESADVNILEGIGSAKDDIKTWTDFTFTKCVVVNKPSNTGWIYCLTNGLSYFDNVDNLDVDTRKSMAILNSFIEVKTYKEYSNSRTQEYSDVIQDVGFAYVHEHNLFRKQVCKDYKYVCYNLT